MKLITANKLKRLWNNGIIPKLLEKLDKTRVLTSKEQVQANTNAENVVGALVAKELINDLGGYSFGETPDGKPGYRKPGADAVTPFLKSKPVYIRAYGYPDSNRDGFVYTCLQISDDNSNWKTVASLSHKVEVVRTTSAYTLQTIV